jgi:hypothetical protein
VRHPNSQNYFPLHFFEDTGASISSILQSDLELLEFAGGNRFFVREVFIQTPAGPINRPVYYVFTKLLGQNFQNTLDPQIIPHLQVNHLGSATMGLEVAAAPDADAGGIRLLGPFLREYFFTATAPDGQGNLVVATNKTGVLQNIPAVQPP